MFRSDEMMRLMNIPDSYEFPHYMGESERVKLIGQSVDGYVVKSIGISVITALMGTRYRSMVSDSRESDEISHQLIYEANGQVAFPY